MVGFEELRNKFTSSFVDASSIHIIIAGAVRATGEGDEALEFEADFLQDPPV